MIILKQLQNIDNLPNAVKDFSHILKTYFFRADFHMSQSEFDTKFKT